MLGEDLVADFVLQLQDNINTVNAKLREKACSQYLKTQGAAKENAPALNSAISSQIPKIDLVSQTFSYAQKSSGPNSTSSDTAL